MEPSYTAVHHRLRAQRGRASDHVCECGAPAKHWSYDRLDPNELQGVKNGRPVRYSADLDHYQPRCVSCNARRDKPLGETCPRGHPRTPENIYHPPGKRSRQTQCRVCVREDSLAAYHRRKRATH